MKPIVLILAEKSDKYIYQVIGGECRSRKRELEWWKLTAFLWLCEGGLAAVYISGLIMEEYNHMVVMWLSYAVVVGSGLRIRREGLMISILTVLMYGIAFICTAIDLNLYVQSACSLSGLVLSFFDIFMGFSSN